MNAPLVVIGDTLLDVDSIGRIERVAPDAPIPVVDVTSEASRAGGAGLAATLAAARAEREVILVTPVANDAAGELLREQLADAGVQVLALTHSGTTVVKRRIGTAQQFIARVDEGGTGLVDPRSASRVEDTIRNAGAVLVADYGHGTAALPWIRDALAARPRSAPLVWDPHPRGPRPVPGVTMAIPNQAEAARLAGGDRTGTGLRQIAEDARRLREAWQAATITVTLGASGAMVSRGERTPIVIPCPACIVADTCGAGD